MKMDHMEENDDCFPHHWAGTRFFRLAHGQDEDWGWLENWFWGMELNVGDQILSPLPGRKKKKDLDAAKKKRMVQ